MAPIASVIPGASYASGTFTIPVSALNNLLSSQFTASDSLEKLTYALLEIVHQGQIAGTVTQRNLAFEVSSKSASTSVWEKILNTFSNVHIVSYLTTFSLDVGPSLENANNITPLG